MLYNIMYLRFGTPCASTDREFPTTFCTPFVKLALLLSFSIDFSVKKAAYLKKRSWTGQHTGITPPFRCIRSLHIHLSAKNGFYRRYFQYNGEILILSAKSQIYQRIASIRDGPLIDEFFPASKNASRNGLNA
jgi:hypothetical protein